MTKNDVKFNFNKSESTESNELKTAKVEKAPADMPELIDNTSEKSENHKETKAKADEVRAVVTYIGNSTWVDSKGKSWKHNDTESYSKEEYEGREDIKFMIKYGEMMVSLV